MLDELILGATCSLVMGAPLGYVVGTLVASLFLIGERLGFTVTERLRSARQSSVD
jgi:predicted MFS family arabinose efflux permease